jgi:hypothetical protein
MNVADASQAGKDLHHRKSGTIATGSVEMFRSMTQQSLDQTEYFTTPTPVARSALQRAAINPSPVHEVPPIVHEFPWAFSESLRAEGRPEMVSHFGQDRVIPRVNSIHD